MLYNAVYAISVLCMPCLYVSLTSVHPGEAVEEMKTSALEATTQLKHALMSEHEVNLDLKNQGVKLKVSPVYNVWCN